MSTLDLNKLSNWVKKKRNQNGLSIEALAREITNTGYPISNNKIWRLETGKIKKLDYELLIRLEAVFQQQFNSSKKDSDAGQMLSVNEVLHLINRLKNNEILHPKYLKPELLLIYDKLKPVYTKLQRLKDVLDGC